VAVGQAMKSRKPSGLNETWAGGQPSVSTHQTLFFYYGVNVKGATTFKGGF